MLQSPPCSSAQALQWLTHASSISVASEHPVYLSCNESWIHVWDDESAFSAAVMCPIPLQAHSPLAIALSLCNRAQRLKHTGMVCVQVRELPPYEAKPKKPASEIVTYANEFLLKFSEVSAKPVYKANTTKLSACSCSAEACLSVVCCTSQCCVCPVHGGACHVASRFTGPWPVPQRMHRHLLLPDVSMLLLAVS